ncbi:THO complex subunit 2, partial [Coemansia nantahalensis]
EDAHRRIERLGGSVSFQLTSLVTHVIVKDGLPSNKYRVSARIGIPVVSALFIDECEKEALRRSRAPLDGGDPASATMAVEQAVERTWYRPFSGCIVCTTGFDYDVREEMSRLVTTATPRDSCTTASVFGQHAGGCPPGDFGDLPVLVGGGGTYSGMLTPTCTHLVAQSPTGQKYKFAKQWGVRVVTFGWFLDSLRTGYRQEEAEYAHGGAASAARKTA